MTLRDKIRIKKKLKNKSTIRVILDHYIVRKDFIDYYFKILQKYGFKLISQEYNGLNELWKSYWCHPKRANKIMVYKSDATLYYDDSVISNLLKKPMCEGCKHINKCYEEGDYLNG